MGLVDDSPVKSGMVKFIPAKRGPSKRILEWSDHSSPRGRFGLAKNRLWTGIAALLVLRFQLPGASLVHGGEEIEPAAAVYQRYSDLGKRLFQDPRSPLSSNGRSCAGCHRSPDDLTSVFEKFPHYDRDVGQFVTLRQQILHCLKRRQAALIDEMGRDEITALIVHLKERSSKSR